MTVTYTAEVATCKGLGCFLKLLLRWRASIYKLVWLDLALFLFIYYSLSSIYRLILDDEQKKIFEAIVTYCKEYSDLIPLSFVLGFYVSIVMTRWWNQYMVIPWPDSIAVFVSATIHGNDERGRLMRRTIVRYFLIVDEMHHEHPELIRDQYWDEIFPTELPYTAAAQAFREEHPQPSTAGIQLSAAQQELQPSTARIDDMAADFPQKFRSDVADDAESGIHFTATGKMSRSASRVSTRDRTLSGGSTPSIIGDSLTRVNSVTSVLKRLFSKDDRPDGGTSSGTKTPGRLATSSSAASLQNRIVAGGGSMRIGVIKEEADEQMTLVSMKSQDKKPHVQSIFSPGPPPPSAPVAVPGMEHSRNGEIFSCSAPITGGVLEGSNGESSANDRRYAPDSRTQRTTQSARSSIIYEPATSYVGSGIGSDLISTRTSSCSSINSDDEFSKLKTEREKKRREKIVRRLARSTSGHNNLIDEHSRSFLDEHLLLTDMANTSRLSMMRGESEDTGANENV